MLENGDKKHINNTEQIMNTAPNSTQYNDIISNECELKLNEENKNISKADNNSSYSDYAKCLFILKEENFFSQEEIQNFLQKKLIITAVNSKDDTLTKYFLFIEIKAIVTLINKLKEINIFNNTDNSNKENTTNNETKNIELTLFNYKNFFKLLDDKDNPNTLNYWKELNKNLSNKNNNSKGSNKLFNLYSETIIHSSYIRTFKKNSLTSLLNKFESIRLAEINKIKKEKLLLETKITKSSRLNRSESLRKREDSVSNSITINKYNLPTSIRLQRFKFLDKKKDFFRIKESTEEKRTSNENTTNEVNVNVNESNNITYKNNFFSSANISQLIERLSKTGEIDNDCLYNQTNIEGKYVFDDRINSHNNISDAFDNIYYDRNRNNK